MSAVHPLEYLIILTDREREYLVRAIESAIHVRKRHQFFLWAQGQFRGVLQHEILVCVRLDDNQQVQQLECLHGTVLKDESYDRLCNPLSGVAVTLARHCSLTNPLILASSGALTPEHAELRALLTQSGLRNALACSTDRILGGNSVYILFDLVEEPSQRHAHLLELLLPHLQMAMMRLAESANAEPGMAFNGATRLVTGREVEILRLLQQGKSNHEIGTVLGISPLTVKNHVQKIYRKLNVQNRAHAVSRGISLRLLDSGAG
ncbi:helix-turn-helix transcriptional regulator [Rhodocyclus tenuis]|uniref:Helix-turn-helix transcriptional regulator n=2 Tax=Rhodocyclus TaxID=1064 RepID=A0A6L5JWS1_RHOTE|nr:XrtB/PEP-CTERM-associated transcriptional regulator EpsA [Rhodocyclus gracilis]MQY51000.1 helix-turn-helix transcriptional regulator [Rhodocyclus gracilis]MRD72979.1 helix-turn-helix transcriptional regulator [Rhodocyclus gracilis]NJA88710.1 helix-turn-helix transcriptional regulator [Rhodocyclus gracilis]